MLHKNRIYLLELFDISWIICYMHSDCRLLAILRAVVVSVDKSRVSISCDVRDFVN